MLWFESVSLHGAVHLYCFCDVRLWQRAVEF